MSNTLKFGAGEWATKVGSTLAYNDENGNFKPLPFNFTRATSATRVNKDGLIEVVTNNKPRIDFKDDANGALLLEPQRTNLLTYSEDFSNSNWSKSNSTSVLSDVISPSGSLNAYKVQGFDGGAGVFQSATVSTNTDYTFSFYARRSELSNAYYRIYSNTNFTNIVNTTSYYNQINQEEWTRVSVTFNSGTSTSIRTYINSITGGAIVWGAQLEQGSYATSYIPTQGAISTRVQDLQSIPAANSNTWDFTNEDFSFVFDLTINDLSNNPVIYCKGFVNLSGWYFQLTSTGALVVYSNQSGASQNSSTSAGTFLIDTNYKITITRSGASVKIYKDGVDVTSVIGTHINPDSANERIMYLGNYNTEAVPLNGYISSFQIYNTALTD